MAWGSGASGRDGRGGGFGGNPAGRSSATGRGMGGGFGGRSGGGGGGSGGRSRSMGGISLSQRRAGVRTKSKARSDRDQAIARMEQADPQSISAALIGRSMVRTQAEGLAGNFRADRNGVSFDGRSVPVGSAADRATEHTMTMAQASRAQGQGVENGIATTGRGRRGKDRTGD